MFVLTTFFAEASTSKILMPLKITIGQYTGFMVIVAVSLIGFGVAQVLPLNPLGS
jgi:cadmium resistance protein CadD (predicted permease)